MVQNFSFIIKKIERQVVIKNNRNKTKLKKENKGKFLDPHYSQKSGMFSI